MRRDIRVRYAYLDQGFTPLVPELKQEVIELGIRT